MKFNFKDIIIFIKKDLEGSLLAVRKIYASMLTNKKLQEIIIKYKPFVIEKWSVFKAVVKAYVSILFGKDSFVQSDVSGDINNKIEEKKRSLKSEVNSSFRFGVRIITVVFVVFILWGGLAPIKSAVVAGGFVIVETKRKTVQHLEGGIISEILVKEGDIVKRGQPLLYLNSTSANAEQQLIMGQYITALATEARLLAERDSLNDVNFSNEVINFYDKEKSSELIDSQKRLFSTRKNALNGTVEILKEKIQQYEKQIESFKSQRAEMNKQKMIVIDQVDTAQKLFEQGYGEKPKLLEYQKNLTEVKSRQAELEAQVSTTMGLISEAKLQIINENTQFLKDVMDELKDVQQKISGFREQLEASRDVLERTIITSPQAGKITGLKQHTIGGVISPGEPIMDIIPLDDKLLIEARVQLQDIDVVTEGQPSKVMLTAYRSRISPRLDGHISYISADKFVDDKTGTQYYLAYVEIDEKSKEELGKDMPLYPGMPTEVFITTGSTTLLKYLLRPLTESFYRSIRD